MRKVVLTGNVTNQYVLSTRDTSKEVTVIVTSGSTLGGGTLSVKMAPSDLSPAGTPETLDSTLAAGSKWTYTVGSGVDIYVNLSGSTSPSITMYISEG